MADDPTTDPSNDPKALAAAYSKFYVADPTHMLAIETKSHIDAPSIRADFNRAAAGNDVVSNLEMSTLSGNPTHVYRPNPLDPVKVDATPQITPLLTLLDRKIQTGQWTNADAAEENRLIKTAAAALKLDEDQVRTMADGYEKGSIAENHMRAGQFGGTLPAGSTELRTAIGETLTRQAFGQPVTPEEEQQLAKNLEQFRSENNFRKSGFDAYVEHFKADVLSHAAERKDDMVGIYNDAAQQAANGYGEAFVAAKAPAPGDVNHVAVPKSTRTSPADDKAVFSAWLVNPADPPGHLPPGSPELGNFLTSLHESEHLSRQGDTLARAKDAQGKNGLSSNAPEQAGEIDADQAVMKYLDGQHETAAKQYWLQAREVNSFSLGLVNGDMSHDTATFLRVYEKTGEQLDLDAFNKEKQGLFDKIKDKVALTDVGRGQGKTADIMGAVQDVLAEDKAGTDPSKTLSSMQRAEAESFLRDAKALGYTANPDYPRLAVPAPDPAPGQAPGQAPPARTADKTPVTPAPPPKV